MKKITKLKLNQLSQNELGKKQMYFLNGGGACTCECYGGFLTEYSNETLTEFGEKCQGACPCVCACIPYGVLDNESDNNAYSNHLDVRYQ